MMKGKHRVPGGAVTRQDVAMAREREARVWTLISQGKSVAYIAQALGYKVASVYALIRRVEARYNEITIASVAEMKARQVRMLEQVADLALASFEDSRKPNTKVVRETGTMAGKGGESEVDLTKKTVERSIGDHRFLAEARGALADIRSIYGLDAPKPLTIPGMTDLPNSSGSYKVEWSNEPVGPKPVEPIDDRYLPPDSPPAPENRDMSPDSELGDLTDWPDEPGDESDGGEVE